MLVTSARRFFALEAAGGLLLMFSAALALLIANSPLGPGFEALLATHLPSSAGPLRLPHSPAAWINDGLMVVFFLAVGLEIKREVLIGALSTRAQMLLPAAAAAGGMAVPALIYAAINHGDAAALRGCAIPAATDIAFSLAVLTLLGRRAPASLKVFLTALAIIDDLGAVLIIAVFYTSEISLGALACAAGVLVVLIALNLGGVRKLWPYLALGVLLWAAVLASGMHATVAGVLLATTIPLRGGASDRASPLMRLERALHPWVAFVVLPIFGLASSGVALGALSMRDAVSPIPVGIAAGLFLGKQIGVFVCAWIAVQLRIAAVPQGASWLQVYGAALLTGIGFTMSLFIGSLALSEAETPLVRAGVIAGSLASAGAGALVFVLAARKRSTAENAA
ncbi:Na+/H+ antiporter NhaA [soil metagenome]